MAEKDDPVPVAVYVTTRMPAELVERLDAAAKEEDRSRSYLIRRAVEAWMKRRDECR